MFTIRKKSEKKKENQRKISKKRERQHTAFQDALYTIRSIWTKNDTEDEYIKDFMNLKKTEGGNEEKKSKYSLSEIRSFCFAAAVLLNVILLLICYINSFIGLRKHIITNLWFFNLLAIVLPFTAWAFATKENFWAFHRRKRAYFYLAFLNTILVVLQPVYTFIRNMVVRIIVKIPTNPVFTGKMVVLLGYMGVLFFMGVIVVLLYNQLLPVIFSDSVKRMIELYKINQTIDLRKNKEYRYDIKTIKNLETGQPIVIKEMDRFLQSVINGASGTGKTSSIFLSVILEDLTQKAKNREKRQRELLSMIREEKATISEKQKMWSEEEMLMHFDDNSISPLGSTRSEYRRNQKTMEKIRKNYSDCGMTIVAPNPTMMKEIIRMAQARDIAVNVVDPVYFYGDYKNVREVSLNPFYLPYNLEESERVIRIMEASSIFSDVLIATNQINGDSDVYFTDISLSVSTNIAAVVMLAKNIMGEQAYIDDIHECISNFGNLKPYVDIIEKEFGINVKISEMDAKNNKGKLDADDILNSLDTQKTKDNLEKEKLAKKNPYYQQILFVKQELLGPGAEKMFDQERGLRNLINKILQDPRIKRKLSATNADRLDFDEILSKNQITVVSTGIELGQSISTSFGLFFLLLHKAAVLRRPEKTRTPHFLWVDECSQYVHPFFDDVIALYRQYKVAAVLTLQTLTQLEKRKSTTYLKNVFLGAGTHMVFGRLAPDEMKLYSEMSGISRENQEQKSVTTNNVLSSNPSYSESTRITPTVTNQMEGADLRMLDFQELTVFTVDNGRVLPGQTARVFFIGPDAYNRQKLTVFYWEKAVPEAFSPEEEKDSQEEPVLFFDESQIDATAKIPKGEYVEVLEEQTAITDGIDEKKKETLQQNDIYQLLKQSQKTKRE